MGVRDVVSHRTENWEFRLAEWHRQQLRESARVDMPFTVQIDPNGVPPVLYFWFFGYVVKVDDW